MDFQSFEREMRNSLEGIRRKIALTAGEPFISAYPARWGSKVEIYLKSGERMVAERSYCKGDPEDPVSLEELKVKSKMLMAFGECKGSDNLMKGILDMAAGCDAVQFDITKA